MSAPVAITVEQGASPSVSITEEPVRAIVIGGLGPPGPAGPPGAGGIEYIVAIPAASITVPHNLGRRPGAVTFYDTSDAEVETGMRVLDLNTIEITMASPLAGRVVVE